MIVTLGLADAMVSFLSCFVLISLYCLTISSLIRGVDIFKRPAREGERPWDTLKGTSVICVPIQYIVAYVFLLEYRGEWDDLYKKGNRILLIKLHRRLITKNAPHLEL